jgi:hypothetical protein
MTSVSRRAFLGTSAIGAAVPLVSLAPVKTSLAAARSWMDGGLPPSFPSQDPDLARQIVGKSHANLDGVRELVTDRPALAKAAWDWGFGDWETALGAASHTGRRDIAELLIAHGARPDIFTFTMMGQVGVVRALCTANPGIQKLHGPHGITLLQHAINAGDAGNDVASYLRELGDADIGAPNTPIDSAAAAPYMGDYRPAVAPESVFHIQHHDRRNCLTFTRDDQPMRLLFCTGTNAFSPAGATAVSITFTMRDGLAEGLIIRDGSLFVEAARMTT